MNSSFKKPLYFYTKRAITLENITLFILKWNYTNYTKATMSTRLCFCVGKLLNHCNSTANTPFYPFEPIIKGNSF